MKNIRTKSLNKRIWILMCTAISVIAFFLLTIATVASVSMLTRRSRELVSVNIKNASDSTNTLFENYKILLQGLIPNEAIQEWLKKDKYDQEYTYLTESSRYALSLNSIVYDDINFIGLIKNDDEYIYRGVLIIKSKFSENYLTDYEKSVPIGQGDLQISYSDTYFEKGHYTLTIYQPVYDMVHLGKQIGMLCVNLKADALDILKKQKVGDSILELYLTESDGCIIYSPENMELDAADMPALEKTSGTLSKGKYYWAYSKVGKTGLYVVGSISNKDVLQYVVFTFSLLILTVFIIVIVCLFMTSWGIKRTYAPLGRLVRYMNKVSEGNLEVRLNDFDDSEDLVAIKDGFNHMMDSISSLMAKVAQQERESQQIRMNAMVEQIKPHFLYNTLDCIHWKAAEKGDREISTIVKALASYYRMVLSGGRDIVTFKDELVCVQNYLILQNMRFDGVAVLHDDLCRDYGSLQIPKLTLQPLVENCIYHGLQDRNAGLTIEIDIRISKEDDHMVIRVSDNGVGLSETKLRELNDSLESEEQQLGYGVKNIHRRIRLLYGEGYGLHYSLNEDGGLTAEIYLPV